MFRISLLTTTAFVMVGSLSLLATQSWAIARSATAEPGRDRNEEFLNTYSTGKFLVFYSYTETGSQGYHYVAEHWQHVAVPIVGKGQTVSSIVVKESAKASGTEFSATISNSSGLFEWGTGTADKKHPSLVVIQIPATTLQKNTTYWITETVPYCQYCRNKAFWKANKRTKLRAYVQDGYYYDTFNSTTGYSWSSSSSGPWTLQSAGPYVRLK
jgi:hypothetical protein